MNKMKFTPMLFIGMLFASCEPQSIDGGSPDLLPKELNAVCELEVQNGQTVNMVNFKCLDAVSCQWTDGISKVTANSGKMQLMGTGEQIVTVIAMDQKGQMMTKEFTVNVDYLAYDVPEIYSLLFNGSEKIWKWTEGNCFGNGGFYDGAEGPQWWSLTADNIDAEAKVEGEGGDATMTFTMAGKKILLSNGTSGTLDFTTSNNVFGNWYGTLSASCGVLAGVSQNECTAAAKGTRIQNYHIISLTEDKLSLAWSEDAGMASWSTGWFWVFKSE